MDAELKQSTPENAVRSFFDALKANDEISIKKIIAPKRRTRMSDRKFFEHWLSVWRPCDVVKFTGPAVIVSSDYDETVSIPVEYKCTDRPNFANAIHLSRVGNIWYWDEN
ncbi:MAG: hypothetical protein KF834_09750 [Burkholderiales bacterium]|nr:hypothetical protein [Burkholderiales bacterium]